MVEASMTLSLTCSCGARLEIDEKFAGQTIHCPDCQQSLQAPPPAARAPRRTSGFAVASFVLALVGAFTLVGTLLAIVLGALALFDIRRQRERVAGRGYAIAGIVLGAVLTALSLFVYIKVELFGLDGLMREPQWAGKLDFNGPLEIMRSQEGFAITRPSDQWGVYNDPLFGFANHVPLDLLLVNVTEGAYILCRRHIVPDQWSLERCQDKALEDFRDADLISGPSKPRHRASQFDARPVKHLPTVHDTEAVEMMVDKTVGGRRRTYLVRVIKKQGDNQMYLVAGGTSPDRFSRLEPQLRKALDSFRLLDRLGGNN
jgi:Domain of unknown function (DUF4190)